MSAMRRVAWLNPFAGIAGDMVLGALLDAGADVQAVADALGSVIAGGWSLRAEQVRRGGLVACLALVETEPHPEPRRAGELLDTVAASSLPEGARERALAVLGRLAEAEARLHGVALADVHLHEVGALDTFVDVVGSCVALDLLGVDDLSCAPVGLGRSRVPSAHGLLPNPAPATLALLEGFSVAGLDTDLETATPTGAALLRGLGARPAPFPPGRLVTTGYGAGQADLTGWPNVLGVSVVEQEHFDPPVGWSEDDVVVLETTLDDVTGETLGWVLSAVLEAGALDAWVTPVVGKKGRPAHVLSVLGRPEHAGALSTKVATETGTLGIRVIPTRRHVAARRSETVEVLGATVRLKHGPWRSKAEHDDLASLARATGRPLEELRRLAEREPRSG